MNYTYIVQCADGTLYTGWTNCLEKRLKAHNSGKNQRRSHELGICNQTINPGEKISPDGILKEVTVPSKY